MNKEKWVWMPHAGHFICGSRCQFKLNTYVGKYIVSTVGELPKTDIDRKYEQELENDWLSQFTDINSYGKYETMVFKAHKSKDKCCPYEIDVSKEVETNQYKTAEEAYTGHLKLCNKYSKK